MPKKVPFFIFFTLCLSLLSHFAWSDDNCKCVTYEQYELIFEGSLIKIESLDDASTTADLPASAALRFKVDSLMVGDAGKTITLSNSGFCPYSFKTRKKYFVFAKASNAEGDNLYFTSSCFGNEEL